MTEAQKAAQKKYVSEKTITVQLRLRIQQDDDIIRRLDREYNKTAYLKALIREDIKKYL